MPRVIPYRDAVKSVGQLRAGSRIAAGLAKAFTEVFQDMLRRGRIGWKFGPGATHVEQTVIIAAGDPRLDPWLRPAWGQIMRFGKPCQFLFIDPIQQRLERFTMQRAMSAIK